MKYAVMLTIATMTLTLTACLHDHSNDYLQAENYPPLKTPAGIASPEFSANYAIPKKSTTAAIPAPNLMPPGYAEDLAQAQAAQKK